MNAGPALEDMLERHRLAFAEDPCPPASRRRADLKALAAALRARSGELIEALSADFGGRSTGDSVLVDIAAALGSIHHAARHVRRWTRPERRRVWPPLQPGRCRVEYQPLGVVGIVVPWNCPVYLCLSPLAGAIAAGNRAMVKLPEATPRTNAVLRELCEAALGDRASLHEGDRETARAFCALPLDHLLFTGSGHRGREAYAAAAQSSVPVTLELGGKSPAIIVPGADIDSAVERIAFGKTLNAGQTCVAPDYLLCPGADIDAVVAAFERCFARMYPGFPDTPDYTRIVSDAHWQRLHELLRDARDKGATLHPLAAGQPIEEPGDTAGRMPLVLVRDTREDMRILHEEIFGPVLPVIGYERLEEALAFVNARPPALAVYAFTRERDTQRTILQGTRSGGVCFNETASQVVQEDLPFGGLGASGMGRYHGREGFRTFSNARAVFDRGRFSPTGFASPPYNRTFHRLLFRWLTGHSGDHR